MDKPVVYYLMTAVLIAVAIVAVTHSTSFPLSVDENVDLDNQIHFYGGGDDDSSEGTDINPDVDGGDSEGDTSMDSETNRVADSRNRKMLRHSVRLLASNPPFCKCRALPRDNNAVCYHMIVPLQSYGSCMKSECSTLYECVSGGGEDLKDCIRRISLHETKFWREEGETLLCKTIDLVEPTFYYTLDN